MTHECSQVDKIEDLRKAVFGEPGLVKSMERVIVTLENNEKTQKALNTTVSALHKFMITQEAIQANRVKKNSSFTAWIVAAASFGALVIMIIENIQA